MLGVPSYIAGRHEASLLFGFGALSCVLWAPRCGARDCDPASARRWNGFGDRFHRKLSEVLKPEFHPQYHQRVSTQGRLEVQGVAIERVSNIHKANGGGQVERGSELFDMTWNAPKVL